MVLKYFNTQYTNYIYTYIYIYIYINTYIYIYIYIYIYNIYIYTYIYIYNIYIYIYYICKIYKIHTKYLNIYFVANKEKRWFSKRVLKENKHAKCFKNKFFYISYPLLCTRTCAYHGLRNVFFSENLAYFVFL